MDRPSSSSAIGTKETDTTRPKSSTPSPAPALPKNDEDYNYDCDKEIHNKNKHAGYNKYNSIMSTNIYLFYPEIV